MKCQARQYSDQMQCAACGLTWDMNDPDPPKCNNGEPVKTTRTFRPPYVRPGTVRARGAAAMQAREEVTVLLCDHELGVSADGLFLKASERESEIRDLRASNERFARWTKSEVPVLTDEALLEREYEMFNYCPICGSRLLK